MFDKSFEIKCIEQHKERSFDLSLINRQRSEKTSDDSYFFIFSDGTHDPFTLL